MQKLGEPLPMSAPRSSTDGAWRLTGQYVIERQNADGGYSFAQGAESSAADTYYALQILRSLGVEPPRPSDTVRFLQRLQKRDGSFDSIPVAFFVTFGLQALGSRPLLDVAAYLTSRQRENGMFGSLQADSETSSELEQTALALEVLQAIEHPVDLSQTCETVAALQHRDGSFGRRGYSRLGATSHALAILAAGHHAGPALPAAVAYVRACEDPAGGFRWSPDSRDGYRVIDNTYFGCRCLALAQAEPRYPVQTLAAIARLRNANGGFRRSPFLGIATFEATHYAVAASRWLLEALPASRRW